MWVIMSGSVTASPQVGKATKNSFVPDIHQIKLAGSDATPANFYVQAQ